MNILHLSHNQIDKKRWDNTIESSSNSLIYGYSWYLDSLSPNWEAFILGDYEIIMPIPVKRKWGLKFVLTPYFVQKIRIFSAKSITSEIAKLFLEKLAKKFHYVDLSIALDEKNDLPSNFKVTSRTNFTLDISKSYQEISANFSKDAKRSLAKNRGISFLVNENIEQVITNYLACYGKLSRINDSQFNSFRKVISTAQKRNQLICATVLQDDEQIASGLFFTENRTAYYVLGAPTERGKKLNATHFLIDGFIKTFADKLQNLDFEGSDIQSVAYFYQKWGSEKEEYYRIESSNNKIIALIFSLRNYFRAKTSS
ncbi:MAG: hypothetical protein PHV20_04285 [Bacteroidales bacterium]|nr:hypothetical protein [Bacteroidales bacterium]